MIEEEKPETPEQNSAPVPREPLVEENPAEPRQVPQQETGQGILPDPHPQSGLVSVMLWLALLGLITLVLYALESVKIAIRDVM